MHTNTEAIAFEIKITMRADGSRSIDSVDANGKGMSLLAVRDAIRWAHGNIDDEVTLAMCNAALVEGLKEKNGLIKPKLF